MSLKGTFTLFMSSPSDVDIRVDLPSLLDGGILESGETVAETFRKIGETIDNKLRFEGYKGTDETSVPAPPPIPAPTPDPPPGIVWETMGKTAPQGDTSTSAPLLNAKWTKMPARNVYSSLQAFNGQMYIGYDDDSSWLCFIDGRAPVRLANLSTPRWLGQNILSMDSGVISVYSPGSTIPIKSRPAPSGETMRIKECYEDPAGGNFAVLFGEVNARVRVYDSNLVEIQSFSLPTPSIDWVGMADAGTVVVQYKTDGVGDGRGVCVYVSGKFVRQLVPTHHHGSLGRVNDSPVYWTIQFNAPENNNDPAIVYYEVLTGNRVYVRSVAWGAFEHISACGPDSWAIVSGDNAQDGRLLSGEIWAVSATGATVRFLQHGQAGSAYWDRPMATMSTNGDYLLFGDSLDGKLVDFSKQ